MSEEIKPFISYHKYGQYNIEIIIDPVQNISNIRIKEIKSPVSSLYNFTMNFFKTETLPMTIYDIKTTDEKFVNFLRDIIPTDKFNIIVNTNDNLDEIMIMASKLEKNPVYDIESQEIVFE
jgi:hypothetical protein